MISAKQFKVILDSAFSGDPILSFTPPVASFTISPNTYNVGAAPNPLVFNIAITANDGAFISWEIKRTDNNTTVTSGTSLTATYSLSTNIPDAAGLYSYSLIINYKYNNETQIAITKTATVLVNALAYVGQLANASSDITNASQVDNILLSTLTSKTYDKIANLFTMQLTRSAKIIFVVPMSFGNVSRIEDENDLDVTNEFTLITDNTNLRYIYVSNNNFTIITELYKFTFN